jgi:multidrug efflux pump
MKFAHFFIDRPVFAAVISIVLVVCGALAAFKLPIAQYPEIAPPTVVISATYPGANARTVAETVATPIEQQVNGVEGMLYMQSQSGNDGTMRLTVTFAVGTNLDIAQVQVQNRVAIAEPVLPSEVRQTGVVVRKSSPDITLIVQLTSPDKRYDTLFMSNYANLYVRDQLARLKGVGDLTVFGARDYAIRLWLNPQELATRNLTAGDVAAAIREQNVQVAAGVIGGPPQPNATGPDAPAFQLAVNTRGRLVEPAEFEQIVVRTGPRGEPVRIKDVGRVELGAADYNTVTYLNGNPSVGMGIFQLPGSNAIDTANAVRAKMEDLKKDFPPGLEYRIDYDTTQFIRESLADVAQTLVEAVLLVVLVVIVFLQGWRASIIPMVAVPVSIVGTCAALWALGFSLNMLSLFGMVLAIGIVVDDAIVVVENVERWIEHGLSPRDAAHKAMTEVTGAVIAIALGLSAVFVPVAFVSGISGQFYRQFALTIAIATVLSAINSLTLSPALAALLLKARPEHGGPRPDPLTRGINFAFGWFFRLFNKAFDATNRGYTSVLRRVLRLSAVALLVYVGLLGLTYLGFRSTPTGFIPAQDSGYLLVNVQLPDAASLGRSDAVVRRLVEDAKGVPGVRATFGIAGFSLIAGGTQSSAGAIFVILEPFDERSAHPEKSAKAVLAALQQKFAAEREALAIVLPPPPIRGLGNAGGFTMQVQDTTGTKSPQELQAAAQKLMAAARSHPETVASLFSTYRSDVPQLQVDVDRQKVKQQNILLADVFQTMQVYLGSLYVNDFNYLGRTYRVVAQADAPFRSHPGDVTVLRTRNLDGQMVPLASVATVKPTVGPDRVIRYNQFAAADINGTAIPGVSSGQALELMEKLAGENLPPGFAFEWTSFAFQERAAGGTILFIFPLCILFVWLTHSAEYESFALSTAIILIVPMCLLFGIAGVWFRGLDNNVFTQIGFVVLAGLSAKNAVLIVEFAVQQEEEGKTPFEAAMEAARLRLRPILMTSFAFILGVLPLVGARGAGAEMRQALGTAVFAGMIGVTFFGVILTPVFYVTIRWLSEKVTGKKGRPHKEQMPGGKDLHGEPPHDTGVANPAPSH